MSSLGKKLPKLKWPYKYKNVLEALTARHLQGVKVSIYRKQKGGTVKIYCPLAASLYLPCSASNIFINTYPQTIPTLMLSNHGPESTYTHKTTT